MNVGDNYLKDVKYDGEEACSGSEGSNAFEVDGVRCTVHGKEDDGACSEDNCSLGFDVNILNFTGWPETNLMGKRLILHQSRGIRKLLWRMRENRK